MVSSLNPWSEEIPGRELLTPLTGPTRQESGLVILVGPDVNLGSRKEKQNKNVVYWNSHLITLTSNEVFDYHPEIDLRNSEWLKYNAMQCNMKRSGPEGA